MCSKSTIKAENMCKLPKVNEKKTPPEWPCSYRDIARTGGNCHINQIDQTTTWKESCILFKKYVKCSLSKHLQNLLRFLLRKNNFFIGKKTRNGNHLSSHTGSSDVRCFEYLKYIYKIQKGREMYRWYVQVGLLLFIFYYWRFKFIMKV